MHNFIILILKVKKSEILDLKTFHYTMIEYNKMFLFLQNLIFYIKKIPFIKYIKKEYNKVKNQ